MEELSYKVYMSDIASAQCKDVQRYYDKIRPDKSTKEENEKKSQKTISSLTSKINKGRGENK